MINSKTKLELFLTGVCLRTVQEQILLDQIQDTSSLTFCFPQRVVRRFLEALQQGMLSVPPHPSPATVIQRYIATKCGGSVESSWLTVIEGLVFCEFV